MPKGKPLQTSAHSPKVEFAHLHLTVSPSMSATAEIMRLDRYRARQTLVQLSAACKLLHPIQILHCSPFLIAVKLIIIPGPARIIHNHTRSLLYLSGSSHIAKRTTSKAHARFRSTIPQCMVAMFLSLPILLYGVLLHSIT